MASDRKQGERLSGSATYRLAPEEERKLKRAARVMGFGKRWRLYARTRALQAADRDLKEYGS